MNRDEAQARMEEIQRIMERATLWTLLPGMAAVIGGLLVLAGCGVSYAMFRSLDFADFLMLPVPSQFLFCFLWFVIGLLGVVVEAVFTFSEYGVVWAAASFGLFHIVFGLYVIRRRREWTP